MRRPKVKLDHLVTVMTVAEKHDLEVVAREMGLTASAVRKQLDAVETMLGVRLFEGKKSRLVPTEDGEFFLKDARESVEHALLAEAKTVARQALRSHHLLVGHSTYLPPKVITLIHRLTIEDSPRVRIEHISGLTSTIVQRVLDGSLHAGFGILPIVSQELIVHPIYEEPLVACIPAGHRLAVKASIHPHELDGEPMIAVGREPMPQLHREIEEHFRDFGVTLLVVADAFAAPEALTYVAQKYGICLLTGSSVIPRSGVVFKPLSTKVLMRRSGVFVRTDNRSPLLQKLIETVLQESRTARFNRGGLDTHPSSPKK